MSDRHRDALAHLLYGVGVGGGFILLTGEVGTGKTTINRCVLEQLPANTDLALVLNPALNAEGLLAAICDELAIAYGPQDQTLKGLTDKLHHFLLDNHQRGRNTVLLIDEAQHLRPEVLEQIRLLTNLETNTRKLLQIILVGQPELRTLLERPELRQLSQRITARFQLKPLSLDETRAYIEHRLQVAGLPANQRLFPPRVVNRIHRVSGGVPRLINIYCDRALLGAYGQHKPGVDQAILTQAVREVRGEDDEGAVPPGRRLAAAAGVLLAIGLGLAGWWYGQTGFPTAASPLAGRPPAMAGAGAALATGSEPGAEPAAVRPPTGSRTEAGSGLGSLVAAEPQAGMPQAGMPQPVAAIPEPLLASPPPLRQLAMGSKERALNALLLREGVLAAPIPTPCAALSAEGWRCEQLQVDAWAPLLSINRPVVLELGVDGEPVWRALLAVEAEEAVLLGDADDERLPLVRLAESWTGRVVLPWQAPPGYRDSLRPGDSGPAVAWLARGFAQLDGQAEGLTDSQYNSLLAQRVKLFQRDERLQVDGIAGLATLLRVDQRLGNGFTLRRQWIAQREGGG